MKWRLCRHLLLMFALLRLQGAAHYLIRMHLKDDARGPAALPPRIVSSSSDLVRPDPADTVLPPAKRLKQQRIVTERDRCAFGWSLALPGPDHIYQMVDRACVVRSGSWSLTCAP